MKAASSLLILIATISLARAGYGILVGRPPFTNSSPLQSGTDGIYQAIASGVNLTGVFSFQIVNGVQTANSECDAQQLGLLCRWQHFSRLGCRGDLAEEGRRRA